MARRRFQDPTPKKRGAWWTLLVWQDDFTGGVHSRKRKRVRLAPAEMSVREVQKVADEYMRPLNQGLQSIGSATNFKYFIETTFVPVVMPLLAKSTQGRYQGIIDNYLVPAFGKLCLRDLEKSSLQRYFSLELMSKNLQHESRDKIRDVLATVLRYAVDYGLLVKNPVDGVRMPPDRHGKVRNKPYLTPEQFELLIALIPEPYASIVYVAIYTGLRVSELAGLRWNDVHHDSITIDERYCRGDWGAPKSEASNATIGVNRCVIERIHRMKLLTVVVKAGTAKRKYKVVKSDGPNDLVFQSVKDGQPIRDNNILSRHIKPAARKLGLDFVNWLVLRRSFATWLKMAGADIKDAQALMRHARPSTTLGIYQQFVPESQARAVAKLSSLTTRIQ
jgi:integrase